MLRVEDLSARAVISVEEFAQVVGISRTAAYDAAKRGEFPVRRLGRRLFVPVPALLAWFGLRPETEPASATATASGSTGQPAIPSGG
jgi:predicted DNA-binding transcriptional regulator AlpA